MDKQKLIRVVSDQLANDDLSTVSSSLEEKARDVARDRLNNFWDSAPLAVIEREVALVLGQLDRVRTLHGEMQRDLLRDECYVGTELLQMEQRTPRYSPDRFPEREKMHRRIQGIHQERRRLQDTHTERLHSLEDRLLSLLSSRAQLIPA